MSRGTVFAQIELELIILSVKPHFIHALHQLVVVVLSLASSDNLTDSRNQTVHSRNRLSILVHLHIERLDILRIVRYEYRTLIDLFRQVTLMFGLQITAPGYLVVELVIILFQKLNPLCIRPMGE